jgi:hypothetical protein
MSQHQQIMAKAQIFRAQCTARRMIARKNIGAASACLVKARRLLEQLQAAGCHE